MNDSPPKPEVSPVSRPSERRGSAGDRAASSRGRAYGVAMELAGSIIGMALIGWFIDRWQGTSPLWTLILTGVGGVGGFYNFLRKALALNREEAAAYKAAHPHRAKTTKTGDKPELFARRDAAGEDGEVPGFDLPPELEDKLERRVEAWKKRDRGDIND
ncbi:MAG: AtpZ/AtpI family protein [Phycisphaerales bacterium]